MEKFFTISQTAKMVDMTTETLRHYDRINLVKPCKMDGVPLLFGTRDRAPKYNKSIAMYGLNACRD